MTSAPSANGHHRVPAEEVEAFVGRALVATGISRRMDGVDRIRIPGEHSHATFLDRRANGIPLARALGERLIRLATELGIEFMHIPARRLP